MQSFYRASLAGVYLITQNCFRETSDYHQLSQFRQPLGAHSARKDSSVGGMHKKMWITF